MKKFILSVLIVTGIYSFAQDAKENQLIDTQLNVSFDYEKEHMHGEEWVTITPYASDKKEVTLDAKGMLIHEVSLVNGKKKKTLKYEYSDNEHLIVQLNKTYKKGEPYTLYIKYTARPNEVTQQGSAAITDAKGLYFIDPRDEDPEKPTQIWTQGETESSSCWFPTLDKPNQKTTQEISMTVPSKYVTLSNGTLISQKDNKDGTRTDTWKQTQKHAPYLFFMGIGDYAVIKDSWKGKPVDYYVEHEYEPYAKEIFGLTPEMITFYSEKFDYEYPWDKYSQMVARDYVSGAMENTTAVLHMTRAHQKQGQLVDENVWEDVISHELAHHWFGDLVTTKDWNNLTVNESFANYSEYLWREYKYGKDHADAHRWDDIQGYLYGGEKNYNKDLVRLDLENREDMFDGVTYNKGGYILHMLRSYLGDDAFFKGLSYYLHQNEYGVGDAKKLKAALEKESGKKLDFFFDQWYYGNGHPKLKIDYTYANNEVTVHIAQTQKEPLFEFPFAIDVYVNGKKERHDVWVKKEVENTFKLKASAKPDVVIANADYDILCEIEVEKSNDEYAAQYQLAKDEYTARKLALESAAGGQLVNNKALETLVDGLDDPYFGLRLQAVNALDITDSKVKELTLAKLKKMATSDKKTLVQAAALAKIGELKNKEYESFFQKGLSSESFAVQGASVSALMEINPEAAKKYAAQLPDEVIKDNYDLIAQLMPIWKANNDTSHFGIMAEGAAFYKFLAFQKPELAKPAEDAFVWIMESDSPSATSEIAKLYHQVYGQVKESQPMAIPLLKEMAERALNLKTEAAKKSPSESMEKQIETLSEVVNLFK